MMGQFATAKYIAQNQTKRVQFLLWAGVNSQQHTVLQRSKTNNINSHHITNYKLFVYSYSG